MPSSLVGGSIAVLVDTDVFVGVTHDPTGFQFAAEVMPPATLAAPAPAPCRPPLGAVYLSLVSGSFCLGVLAGPALGGQKVMTRINTVCGANYLGGTIIPANRIIGNIATGASIGSGLVVILNSDLSGTIPGALTMLGYGRKVVRRDGDRGRSKRPSLRLLLPAHSAVLTIAPPAPGVMKRTMPMTK